MLVLRELTSEELHTLKKYTKQDYIDLCRRSTIDGVNTLTEEEKLVIFYWDSSLCQEK